MAESVRKIDVDRRALKNLLCSIDFSEKQAAVYLALLELGEASKSELAKAAKIKRPTLYLILDQLEKKEIITLRREGSRELVRAVNLHAVVAKREQLTDTFARNIPAFLSVAVQRSDIPELKPILGVQDVIMSMRDRLNSKTEIYFWADKDLQFTNQKLLMDFQIPYRKRRVEKGIWTRGLIPYEPVLHKIKAKRLKDAQTLYLELRRRQTQELRDFVFIDRNEKIFDTEIWIYDDRVDFYSSLTCIGTRIRSEPFAQTMRSIFLLQLENARVKEKNLLSVRDRRWLNTAVRSGTPLKR
jgi:DNA-binding MarR family transcriptional regulator